MARQLKIDDNRVTKILEELSSFIRGKVLFDEDFKYKILPDKYEDRDAYIVFTASAYAKMASLINIFDKEVAWHGVVEREDNVFTITDILVYPQEVSGTTVNTDQEEYQNWPMGLPDDVFNNLRMQGHSHVNMSTSPSSVDLTHQEAIVDQLGNDDYYIFMIWNKSAKHTIRIFDVATNTFYDDSDITVSVEGDDALDEFITEAKSLVKEKTYNYYGGYYSTKKKEEDTKDKDDKPKSKNKKHGFKNKSYKKPVNSVGYNCMEEYLDGMGCYYGDSYGSYRDDY